MDIKIIEEYIPKNEQEATDKKAMIDFANNNKNSFLRDSKIAHFTNSAIILNKKRDKVLLIYHLIYKSWSWVGGHNDGNVNFLEVVIKEAIEETGVKKVVPILKEPISLDNIYVPYHIKNGEFVGDHIHMNLTFLLEADESEELVIKPDENSGVKWFKIDEVLDVIEEERMIYIYKKIFNEIRENNY